MNACMDAVMQALYGLLANPGSTGHLWLVGALAMGVFLVFFNKLSQLMSYPLASMTLSVCVLVLVVFVTVGSGAVAVHFLSNVKLIENLRLADWLPLIAGLLGVAAIAAPAMRLITRSRYGPSLAGLLLSLLAVAITVVTLDAAASAFRSGDQDFGRTRDRTKTVDRFLGN